MKKMIIFEPAMCCPTGICGPSVDPELLRMSTVINNLRKNGVRVSRYNLSGNPDKFVVHEEINEIINEKGVESLPVTTVDGEIVKIGSYPSNKEICSFLEIDEDLLKSEKS
ncbi:arsenical resistance operon trans-acting repressor ArsD [Andreesenia angusta]|uniref:Arsenical resistance operon trans-acting repressor ArsD n=1 Tax=Andreesenia angusta TaxID=39480 RepID=A0A1S1V9R3_9FIRM|nr:arsenite efflux transporter metallochaperone ArsD [Andreesenia angusta]OHW63322.1 arsenical resistance operon trans-acting repressor ArsD [Andreesenia angusta]